MIGAIVVADAGFYAVHRMFHAVPLLWRFRAVHHSIEELDWLAAHRVHPADQLVHAAASYLPLYMLGFPVAAIAAHGTIYLVQSHLNHSNVRIGFGRCGTSSPRPRSTTGITPTMPNRTTVISLRA